MRASALLALTWLYGLFVRTLMLLTNAYTGCGRHILNFIELFRLRSVRSASKLNSKWTQTNYEMNWITMHRSTEMYSKRPASTLASASLVPNMTAVFLSATLAVFSSFSRFLSKPFRVFRYPLVCKTKWTRARVINFSTEIWQNEITFFWLVFTGLEETKIIIHLRVSE